MDITISTQADVVYSQWIKKCRSRVSVSESPNHNKLTIKITAEKTAKKLEK